MITPVLALLLFVAGPTAPDHNATLPAGTETLTAAQEQTDSPEKLVAKMTSYEIGILRKGPKWTTDSPARLEEAMKKKQEPWRKAAAAGNLVGVLRVVDPNEIVAVLFFKNKTSEEMKQIAAKAPAITSGILTAEVQKVWGTRGLGTAAATKLAADSKAKLAKQTSYVVIATKGKNWSEKADSPETRTATQEQIKYLYGLYTSGALKFHCSLEDLSQATRSITILKAGSEKEALALMNASPAVKQGWLVARVRKVTVPEGMLP
jgi:uncharacterized protein YciI